MHGDLSETSAADACRQLAGDGATGTLALGGLDGPGRIVFEQGRIVSANAPTSTARLGDRLVGAGFLTEAELLDVLAAQRSGQIRGRLGALLVERSLVARDAIRLFVQEQTLDALFEVLRWRYGSFAFQPGLAEDRSGVRVAMPVDDVLLVIGRRHEEWAELSRSIPDLAAVPSFSTNVGTVTADLEPDEFAVLASVDGDRDVRELAADLGYNEIELARIVYGLTLLGIVDIRLPEDEIGAALDAALRPFPETDADAQTETETETETETDAQTTASTDTETGDQDTGPLARVIQLPTSRQQPTDDHGEGQPDEPAADGLTTDPAEVRDPRPATDESPVAGQRAASMVDPSDTGTSTYPEILRQLREHSIGVGRGPDATATADTPDVPADATVAAASQVGDAEKEDVKPRASTPRRDGDVSEFLRELSRLAGDDAPAAPQRTRPADRSSPSRPSAVSGTSNSSGSSGSSDDDDPKRRRRGLFGRG